MHGIVKLTKGDDRPVVGWQDRFRQLWQLYRGFVLIVLLPTLIAAVYYAAISSDQYEAKADFVVKRADANATSNGMGQLLGLNFGTSATSSEAYIVADYLLSHDAVERLRREDGLVAMFQRPSIDWISRLWTTNPTPERVEKYYRRQVTINHDTETGITHLRVHAFSPQDAYQLGRKLLLLGEERINSMNERSYRDQVAHSRRELDLADKAVADAENELTRFRRGRADIDPASSGKAQLELVTTLTGSLTQAKAKLQSMRGVISPSSPQYRAMEGQVRALEAQIGGQSQRLAGSGGSIAATLGDYESLTIRRESAVRRYATAAAEFEQAKAEAQRKQIYLVRVVDVNMPVKSLYPERAKTVLTIFLSLVFAYLIGWLIFAGIKEHQI